MMARCAGPSICRRWWSGTASKANSPRRSGTIWIWRSSTTGWRWARKALAQNADLLERIEAQYGVDREVVVAIWGLESAYGTYRGDTDTLSALATLAYDGRRAAFFEAQLMQALKILDGRACGTGGVAGQLGRGDGAHAVHALQLGRVRGGFRRRRAARYLGRTIRQMRWPRPRTIWRIGAGRRVSPGGWKCGCRRASTMTRRPSG